MKLKPIIDKYPDLASLVISAIIAGVIFLTLLFSIFEILVHFYPAETVLEDGEIVKNEAFAQFFMSLVVSGTLSFILFIVLFFKLGRKFNHQSKPNT